MIVIIGNAPDNKQIHNLINGVLSTNDKVNVHMNLYESCDIQQSTIFEILIGLLLSTQQKNIERILIVHAFNHSQNDEEEIKHLESIMTEIAEKFLIMVDGLAIIAWDVPNTSMIEFRTILLAAC